jgi:hypothetical protein
MGRNGGKALSMSLGVGLRWALVVRCRPFGGEAGRWGRAAVGGHTRER